jgi:NADPH:quinone reductase-like Zn-dependent oxidoreductase
LSTPWRWKEIISGQARLAESVMSPSSLPSGAAHGVRQGMVYSSPPIRQTLTEIAKLVDEGQLKPVVSKVLPLQEVQKAHQMIEGKHVSGKIILQVA